MFNHLIIPVFQLILHHATFTSKGEMICGYNLQVLMSSGSSVIQSIVIREFKNTQDAELTTILMRLASNYLEQTSLLGQLCII